MWEAVICSSSMSGVVFKGRKVKYKTGGDRDQHNGAAALQA